MGMRSLGIRLGYCPGCWGRSKSPVVGVPVISDPKDVPKGERVISYVFRFKHRDAVEMQQLLGQYLSPPRAYTSLLADRTGSNTVVATERTV